MFPFIRLSKELVRASTMEPLPMDGVHETHHLCWPVDLDFQFELNNGRVLTIYDLGRIPLALRVGLLSVMRKNSWGFAMAGASVRYRRRVRLFDKLRMTSRGVGRDARFIYLEQTLWKGDEATSNILYRAAVTSKSGIVPTDEWTVAMGKPDWNPEMPEWVKNWADAENSRIWPPID